MFEYPVLLTPAEEGGFVVTFPDVPEAITQGEDKADALLHARDALESALMFYLDDWRSLPKPSVLPEFPTVSPETLSCAKLALYQAMYEKRPSKADLARRLGISVADVENCWISTMPAKSNRLMPPLRFWGSA
ncbi:MAG: type II toxin-antitoxin system HicB family antitoxin [Proteobacteria bacterium]|nr:type II toxin-antitoxin system HicB family antitoxin [Pseudomonadota bacterium]